MSQIGFVYNLSAHLNSTERSKSILSIAVWYFDGVAYSTLPTITKFESGGKYVYSVMLLPKIGYTFSKEVTVTVNGNTVTAVPATYENLSFTNVKTITPTAITQVNIESLYNYGVGDFPKKRQNRLMKKQTNMRLPTNSVNKWKTAILLRSGTLTKTNIFHL